MRYDTKVSFYQSNSKYDPRLSKYSLNNELLAEVMANVTDLGIDRQMQIFGVLKQGQKTIRLINSPPKKWSFLMIDGDKAHYKISSMLQVSKGSALIVGAENGD